MASDGATTDADCPQAHENALLFAEWTARVDREFRDIAYDPAKNAELQTVNLSKKNRFESYAAWWRSPETPESERKIINTLMAETPEGVPAEP